MHCVHCGNEIPEKHGFCSKCGKQAGAPKTGLRASFIVALLAVSICCFLFFHFDLRPGTVAANLQPNSPQLKLYTESIDAGFTVPKLGSHAYKFMIPVGAIDPVLQGHFDATGGAGNDVEVWLMNDDQYVNWQNRHSVTPIYSSGRVTQGTVNIPLPQPGTYYLVFNNRFSLVSPKAVQDNISLTYKR
jgi:predicted nucleic acid-binding Zn ribbon protein